MICKLNECQTDSLLAWCWFDSPRTPETSMLVS